MPICFKCRYCRGPLWADVRLIGSPIICSVCNGEVLVPAICEPLTPDEEAKAPPEKAEAPAAPPAAAAQGAYTPRSCRRHPGLYAAVAVAALLALYGGYLASKDRSTQRKKEEAQVLEKIETLLNPSAEAVGGRAAPVPAEDQRRAPEAPAAELRGVAVPLRGLASPAQPPREQKAEKPSGGSEKERPGREAEQAVAAKKPALPRRQKLSEDELRDQLARAPEVGLGPTLVPSLLQAYQNDFQARARVTGGISVEPTVLLQLRPDLKGFPVRQGRACQLDLPSAVTLQTLSQKLRVYLQAAVPRDPEGNRPAPVQLREALRLEMRGQRPEWLRAEAIPTLQQLLMHEDQPLRLMLVDLLAEIKGPAATAALARRAVFDLSAEVRAAAVEALRDRSREDARPWLLYGLRYPWPPAADHAAEALTALGDQEAVPQLVSLLKQPDPVGPAGTGGAYFVREVVRVNHLNNCLLCHPPGITGSEPVLGLDPVVRVPGLATQLAAVQRIQATPGSHGYGLGRSSSRTTTQVVPVPLLIRGDVTYLRQDFSLQLAVRQPGAAPQGLRFDYLVRTRPATADEVNARKAARDPGDRYPQRDAVLFALRHLTGRDAGPTTEGWQQLFPTAELDIQVARLSAELVQAPPARKEYWINYLRDGKGNAYTLALASAIAQLKGTDRDQAREALVQRLTRMTADTLRDKLQDESAEVRRAAALACAHKEDLSLVPDLIALLGDPEPPVAAAVHSALQRLSGENHRTAAAWLEWWGKQAGE